MKIYSFFRLLNYKIKQYEKAASRDEIPRGKFSWGKFSWGKFNGNVWNMNYPITIIWVEDSEIYRSGG